MVGGRTIAAQDAFHQLCRVLIQLANAEARLRSIAEEIKKTARRVNALQQTIIPGIRLRSGLSNRPSISRSRRTSSGLNVLRVSFRRTLPNKVNLINYSEKPTSSLRPLQGDPMRNCGEVITYLIHQAQIRLQERV